MKNNDRKEWILTVAITVVIALVFFFIAEWPFYDVDWILNIELFLELLMLFFPCFRYVMHQVFWHDTRPRSVEVEAWYNKYLFEKARQSYNALEHKIRSAPEDTPKQTIKAWEKESWHAFQKARKARENY